MKKNEKSMSKIKIFTVRELFGFYIAVLICLLMICDGIRGFYNGFHYSLTKINEKPIATVSSSIKLSRRCFDNRTVWDFLKKDSPIYNGDTIKTDGNSQTTIVFLADGLELTLTENTMTKIHLGKDNSLEVLLTSGNVLVDSVQSEMPATIIYNNTNISMKGKAMVSAVEYDEEEAAVEEKKENSKPEKRSRRKKLEVQVLNGKADVQANGEEKFEIQNGEMVTVTAEKKRRSSRQNLIPEEEISKIKDIVSRPTKILKNKNAHQLTIYEVEEETQEEKNSYTEKKKTSAEKTQQLFSEMKSAQAKASGEEKYNVESRYTSALFDKIQTVLDNDEKSAEREVSVPNIKSKNVNSSVKKTAKQLAEIVVKAPVNGKVLNDSFFMKNEKIDFSWQPVSGATHYEFVLRNEKGAVIEKLLVSGKSSCSFEKLELLSNGNFSWTVKALRKTANGKFEDLSLAKKSNFKIQLGSISGEASTNGTLYIKEKK